MYLDDGLNQLTPSTLGNWGWRRFFRFCTQNIGKTPFFQKNISFYGFIFETSNLKENAVNYKYSLGNLGIFTEYFVLEMQIVCQKCKCFSSFPKHFFFKKIYLFRVLYLSHQIWRKMLSTTNTLWKTSAYSPNIIFKKCYFFTHKIDGKYEHLKCISKKKKMGNMPRFFKERLFQTAFSFKFDVSNIKP